jgi:glucan phosphoethanolaminetransferase (alkaline phosphatase superfamily)
MMGSHWMYTMRYGKEFEKFTPTADSKYIPSNSKQAMINSYDNTILVLDYFLNKLIEDIKKQNNQTILIYLSDHGESLGENGNYLHAENGEELLNPAGIIWCSPKYIENNQEQFNKLIQLKNKTIQLDFLYPTILDIFQVKGIKYDKGKSLLY